ncbi:MAG: 4-hydroxy-tetrahydrodipicolinate reductase [Bacteroidales bacterium]|jgi:4-hydroxy-tetrahydrodipicolinate reductase|nr:4-hydroxy-tetrahydrodipicolinate reductase [Bacteroidales bacterium]
MEIAILGYGRMGKEIAEIAEERGHEVSVVIDSSDDWMENIDKIRDCDVAIDFSTPDVVVDNIFKCFNINVPIVVGTTGWYDQLESVVHDCCQREQSLFVASNFSIGVNILFSINKKLAEIMNNHPEYDVSINETHHIHKLDAPSGTAISLAQGIIENLETKEEWVLNECESVSELPIYSTREGEVPGIHEVKYDSLVDTIVIKHNAKSRKGFALGAVIAAEFLANKKGYYTMEDLLKA